MKTTRLAHLIKSGEIDDRTPIQIYGSEGKFITEGKWYEDKILNYTENLGFVEKSARNLRTRFVIFQLA